MLMSSCLMVPLNAISPHKDNPFQQEGSKSKPFKVVINLEYADKQYSGASEKFHYVMKKGLDSIRQNSIILTR
jgi:hypothetical protein